MNLVYINYNKYILYGKRFKIYRNIILYSSEDSINIDYNYNRIYHNQWY